MVISLGSSGIAAERVQSTSRDSRAQRQAFANFIANLASLRRRQPALAVELDSIEFDIDFLFARDRYLSGQVDGRWLSGCSVPLGTARQFLKKLEMVGTVGCFLNPTHAGQLRAGFEKISPIQGLLAVVPDLGTLVEMLHCDDFSTEIVGGRLLIAAGAEWPARLDELFRQFQGLPLPEQFLRTALLDDEAMAPYVEKARTVISEETQRRAQRLDDIRNRNLAEAEMPPGGRRDAWPRLLVIAGSQFNLPDWSSQALAAALLSGDRESPFIQFDPDHVLTASPLSMAEAAESTAAIIAVDLFRSDFPGVVRRSCSWITWATGPRIAGFSPDFPEDSLLIAEPELIETAIQAGWPRSRMGIAGWPSLVSRPGLPSDSSATSGKTIAMLVDTRPIEAPPRVVELSSHMLLWEMIDNQLGQNPFALGTDPLKYLAAGLKQFGLNEESLDQRLFLDRLILPAYNQGLARALLAMEAPLVLYGKGWQALPEFAGVAQGPVESLATFRRAIESAALLINPSPDKKAAALQSTGVTVLQPAGRDRNWLRNSLPGRRDIVGAKKLSNVAPLSPGCVLSLLSSFRWPTVVEWDRGAD